MKKLFKIKRKSVWITLSVDGPEAKKGSDFRWRAFIGESKEKIPLKGVVTSTGKIIWEDVGIPNERSLIGWAKMFGDFTVDTNDVAHIKIRSIPKKKKK